MGDRCCCCPAAAASAQAVRQATAAAAAEALRWKPEDIEWVRQHPASEKGDWVEPSDETAYATPVDPLTDQNPVDHLPCEIALVLHARLSDSNSRRRCANTRSSRHSRTDSATAPPSTRSTGPRRRTRPNLSRPRTTNSRRESNGRCFSALPSRRPSKVKIHVTRTAGRTGRNSPRSHCQGDRVPIAGLCRPWRWRRGPLRLNAGPADAGWCSPDPASPGARSRSDAALGRSSPRGSARSEERGPVAPVECTSVRSSTARTLGSGSMATVRKTARMQARAERRNGSL